MGLTFEINSTKDMCRLMCDNYIPERKGEKTMTNKYDNAVKATDQVLKELNKIKARYQKKIDTPVEKEPPFVVVEDEKCYTEKDIFGWYEAGYIGSRKYDNLVDKLRALQAQDVDNDKIINELIVKILNGCIKDLKSDKEYTQQELEFNK